MTVGEMCDRMTNSELLEWMALDELRGKEREAAEKRAKKGMKPR